MDKNKVYIFDDFLTLEQQDLVEKEIIKNTLWKWRASFSKLFPPPTEDELKEMGGTMRPLAMDAPKNKKIKIKDNLFWNQSRPGLMVGEYYEMYSGWSWWSEKTSIISPLEALDLKYYIQRIKVNMNPKEIPQHKGSCYVPHVDIEKGGGWTGIYYVNDSDGGTVIFNELTNTPIRNNEEISVKQVVQNKRGRMVIFNQDSLHAGCPPIESDNRIVINYNFKI
jgi:hypothetical protein